MIITFKGAIALACLIEADLALCNLEDWLAAYEADEPFMRMLK